MAYVRNRLAQTLLCAAFLARTFHVGPCWDASAFIFEADSMTYQDSFFALLLLKLNGIMQLCFIIIVTLSLANTSLDADAIEGFLQWRTNTGHASEYTNPLTLESVATRVCRGDTSLHLCNTQTLYQVPWAVLKNLTVVVRAAALLYDYGKDSRFDTEKKRKKMGKRIYQLIMDAGGIFPKVGQNLAKRPDLIAYWEIREEPKKCQAQVPAMMFKKVLDLLNLCKIDIEKVFPLFNQTTLAATSIGQLHTYDKSGAMVLKVLNLENQAKIQNQKSLVEALTLYPAKGMAKWMIALIDRSFHDMEKEGNLSDEFRNTTFGKAMIDAICSNPEGTVSGCNVVFVPNTSANGANMICLPQQNIHIIKSADGSELSNDPCIKFESLDLCFPARWLRYCVPTSPAWCAK